MTLLTRRTLSTGLVACALLPAPVLAQGAGVDSLRRTARGLKQLHAILVQRGDDLLLAEAPRGPGLDRAANIKSCSKSVVACSRATGWPMFSHAPCGTRPAAA